MSEYRLPTAFSIRAVCMLVGMAAWQGCSGSIQNHIPNDDNAVCIVDVAAQGQTRQIVKSLAAVLEKEGITCVSEGNHGLASLSVPRSQAARALEILAPKRDRLKSQGAAVLEWEDVITQAGTPLSP
jgi:hypothetical protein